MRQLPDQRATAYLLPGCLLGALLCSFALSAHVPPSWARENGVLENAGVAVLAVGLIIALIRTNMTDFHRTGLLARAMIPVWLVLIGRELSWGAVLMGPYAFDNGLPLYSSRDLWYKPAIMPAALIALACSGLTVYRYMLEEPCRQAIVHNRALMLTLLICIGAASVASYAEGHVGHWRPFNISRGMAWEEFAELIAYFALVYAQVMALQTAPLAYRVVDAQAK